MHEIHSANLTKQERSCYWDKIVVDFEASGLTIKSYSEAKKLKYDNLLYHVNGRRRKHRSAPNGFVALPPLPSSANWITLRRGEMVIELPLATPKQILIALLSALERSC